MGLEYRNREKLKSVYCKEDKTIKETAEHFDASSATIQRWLKRLDIETREKSYAPFRTTQDKGYEMWYYSGARVYVHRLLSVAEHGLEETVGKRIHHKNGIPWDNRPENIEPLTRGEHRREHQKAAGKEREAIAYAYEFTEMSSRDVAETCDYTQNSILRIHREFFG